LIREDLPDESGRIRDMGDDLRDIPLERESV